LCFDEFHITDIADAMILGRLFTRLFELGVVVGRNVKPCTERSLKDGLNRACFCLSLPCSNATARSFSLRRASISGWKNSLASDLVCTGRCESRSALDEAWRRLAGGHAGEPQE
jgi:cell division protein ZapE